MSEDDLLRKPPVGKHTEAEQARDSEREDGHKRGAGWPAALLFGSAALGAVLLMSKRMRGRGHDL